jgi:thiamine phosphate synthase YjbQ (UPF0047 family)
MTETERAMLCELSIQTGKEGFYDITGDVQDAVRESGLQNGIAVVFAHTPQRLSQSTRMTTLTWCATCC